MSQREPSEESPKILVMGDDPIASSQFDWFHFAKPAAALADQLYEISKSSGICCGILGSWGSGKSSFMNLMREHVKATYPESTYTASYTAWDPGGIKDLGDAMLYRLFSDLTMETQELSNPFDELKNALGIRKSVRDRAASVLAIASKSIPGPAGTAMEIAGNLITEFDVPKKVGDCFENLVRWLAQNNRVVFFFVDDIDRATGEQIRDLLSELKVYVSRHRIVTIIGYDEDYVLNALKQPTLPPGIDPKRYLEKVVTIRRTIPAPGINDLRDYARRFLERTLPLGEPNLSHLTRMSLILSSLNPRLLKTLLLAFANSMPADISTQERYWLASALITTAASQIGIFSYVGIREVFDRGNEQDMITALQELGKTHSETGDRVSVLTQAIQRNSPNFRRGTVDDLRIRPWAGRLDLASEIHPTPLHERFEWSNSFAPILARAAQHGFTVTSDIAQTSTAIVVPAGAMMERGEPTERPSPWGQVLAYLDWQEGRMAVAISSHFKPPARTIGYIRHVSRTMPSLVTQKAFITWIIDDTDELTVQAYNQWSSLAAGYSKGLKHPFLLAWTPSSKVGTLIDYLMSVALPSK